MAEAVTRPATGLSHLGARSSGALARIAQARFLALPLTVAALAFGVRLSVGPLTIDDAYITFRYARNLASGLGFVYNPGQHVIGTTTPLYTMILALGYRLGVHDLPHLALVLAALADAATTVLTYSVARSFGFERRWASIAAVLFAICGLSIAYAAGGMETSLFTLLVVSALASEMADRGLPSGIFAGLAVLTRPEGVLVVALIAGRRLLAHRTIPWRVILPVTAIYLPWLLYAYWWTGSILSGSVVAKASAYGDAWLGMVGGIMRALSAPGLDSGYNIILYSDLLLRVEVVALFCILLAAILTLVHSPRILRSLRQHPTWCPFVAFGPLLVAAYCLAGTRGVRLFPWYVAPLAPFAMVGAVGALRFVAKRISKQLAFIAAVVVIAWTGYGLSLGSQRELPFFAPRGLDLGREEAYQRAATVLAPQLRPGTVAALQEIGAFGYFTDASVLDVGGLVSPEARHFFPLPKGDKIPAGLIRQRRPDWLVVMDVYMPSRLKNAGWFRREYRLVGAVPLHYQGRLSSKAVLMYRRQT